MSKQKKKQVIIKPVDIPAELRDKVNNVKNRILFLSPSVTRGEERECRKDDFESLANSNIGVGGFGKVYKVRHKVSKNVFAIKVINKKKILEHDLVEQIKLEVKIMYKLDHDHILRLYNHYEDDDNFYLILQFCGKGQIYSMLKKEGRFNEKIAAQYLRECIAAVQYLHSLEPPIIHRDIKPENILLDSNGMVKLADFGWSNYFDDDNRRLTYCGTPEYLAPEMIKQSGHDKALDVWNLGVLLFELLTGSPPFEGGSQSDLFSNILALKIKWPKGFSGIAKDLISKLLKIDPKNRIPVGEITEHPWFKSIPQIRPVSNYMQPSHSNNLIEQQLEKKDYQVVSKPSVANKAEANEENSRTSVLDKKLNKVKKMTQNSYRSAGKESANTDASASGTAALASSREESGRLQDLQQKMLKLKKENQDLKFEHQKKCNEAEQKDKKIKEQEDLIKELQQYKGNMNSSSSKNMSPNQVNDVQIRQLQDEVQRLRSINKNRDNILSEIDSKNQSLRETETQLKLTQNDIEILQNKTKQLEAISKEYAEKNEALEKRVQTLKENQHKTQKEKDQIQIELNNKIEILQYKLLNGGGASTEDDDLRDSQSSMTNGGQSAENTFKDLLSLSRGDLNEITQKMKHLLQTASVEDQLRDEIIDQGRKMNELRSEHEQAMYEQSIDCGQKVDMIQQKYDQEKKKQMQKYKDDINMKNEKIQDLERQQQKDKAAKLNAESAIRQLEEIQELQKAMQGDQSVVKQEKDILSERVKQQNEEIVQLKDKLHANYKP